LTGRADHYERCLTLDAGAALPPPLPAGAVAGVDLGEVHVAAVTTTRRQALVVSGRQLRSCKHWRNTVHRMLHERLSRRQAGSRRAKRLLRRQAQLSAEVYRQQREMLHQAARTVVAFCQAEGVSLGKQTNQKISQWPHGQVTRYVREQAARLGMVVEWINEAYSTRTCSHSGHVQSSSPRRRRVRWAGCGAQVQRDVNGASHICSKAAHGVYSKVHADTITYLRPIGGAPLTRATRS
jgi:putative transposase